MNKPCCSLCGGSLIKDDNHFEFIDVCTVCGASESAQQLQSEHNYTSPKKQPSRDRSHRNVFNVLSQLDKKPSKTHRECDRLLKSCLTSLQLSNGGSVAAEAQHNLAQLLSKVRRVLHKEAAVCACAFVAIRTHQPEISLKRVTDIFGVPAVEVRKYLRQLESPKKFVVQAGEYPSVDNLLKETLQNCFFWKSDGSGEDEGAIMVKTKRLMLLLERLGKGQFMISKDLAYACSFLAYKHENLALRRKMPLKTFMKQCNIDIRPSEEKSVDKTANSVFQCLKDLARGLPFVLHPKSLRVSNVLNYLDDLFEFEDQLFLRANSREQSAAEAPQKLTRSANPHVYASETTEEDEEIPDEEIDEYIRSEEEVQFLKPIYEEKYSKHNV